MKYKKEPKGPDHLQPQEQKSKKDKQSYRGVPIRDTNSLTA